MKYQVYVVEVNKPHVIRKEEFHNIASAWNGYKRLRDMYPTKRIDIFFEDFYFITERQLCKGYLEHLKKECKEEK